MNDLGQLVKSLGFIEEFVETTTSLSTERDIGLLLEKVLLSARSFCNCEAGRLYVLDVTKRYLELRISQWPGCETAGQHIRDWYQQRDFSDVSAGCIQDPLQYCAMTGTPVFIDDLYRFSGFDLEYLYQQDALNHTRTTSIVLVPLRDHDNQTIGILELINARDAWSRRYVSFRQLEGIISAFASQTAVCINNAMLIDTNRQLIELLDATNRRLEAENLRLKERNRRQIDYRIIGSSVAMQRVYTFMDKAVDTSVSILLQGETGTGKEVFARAIHENSARRKNEFVTQNCAALPEQLLESELFGYRKGAFTGATTDKKGLFELAHQGTLFLDEIGDMPINLQSKLLRVLQEGEVRPLGATRAVKVDVRIVAATHSDLESKISEGAFREDLYFRLNVFPIRLPPLRERDNDIKVLLDYFIDRFCDRYAKRLSGIAPSAMNTLMRYRYPGNVRELQNVIERAVLLCEDGGAILTEHLSDELQETIPEKPTSQPRSTVVRITSQPGENHFESLKSAVNAYEIEVIEQHLKANNWNQTRTAETLQIPRRTLIDKINRYKIKRPQRT